MRQQNRGNGLVAVAIDREKGSQNALRWAADNLIEKGNSVILIHVVQRPPSSASLGGAIICDFNDALGSPRKQQLEKMTQDLFLTFHCYCTRKDIQCLDIILEDTDIVKALTEYVSYAAIENLVLGAPAKHGFIRFRSSNIPSSVSKMAPDFCTVYVVSKGKVSTVRNASRTSPFSSPLQEHIRDRDKHKTSSSPGNMMNLRGAGRTSFKPRNLQDGRGKMSPVTRGRGWNAKTGGGGFSESESDISFISSDRASTDGGSSLFYDYVDSGRTPRLSTSSDQSLGSSCQAPRWAELNAMNEFSSVSQESNRTSCSWSSQNLEDVDSEMRRLKLELKQTMEMYSTACKEALTAQQKAVELQSWRLEEERKLESARLAQEAALAVAGKERLRCQAAMEAADAAKRIAELESQKRASLELKALKDTEEFRKASENLAQYNLMCRKYSIEEIELATEAFAESRKIGEGGYGPVYKCYLDHTPVAVKVLRQDASQGRLQFQQEIDILSRIRHPNMVLLLGACPEYSILVYEYMANGSLDDRLFMRGNTPVLSWQLRFRIAADIATGLLFLHQTKPEPLVHRDLKPGNILLDHNYVSKISDVGLARLVPAVAENITQYCMTSTAGTFCYIDPEYQQTGMLGVKSDVYSLGIMLLQILTGKPPMGLAHYVGRSIEKGTFTEMLDQAVPDWPVEEALRFAKLALQCAELRRKDRPELGETVLPELNKLREFAEENDTIFEGNHGPYCQHVSSHQDEVTDLRHGNSGSSRSHSSTSSHPDGKSDHV